VSQLGWRSSMVWFPCPEGCNGLIRATVTGEVTVGTGPVVALTTTAKVDRSAFNLHMAKNHGKVT
jgi:hypothetical protein